MAYEIPRISSINGRNIVIAHLDSLKEPVTYLSSLVAVSGVSLTVLNNAGFSNTNLLLIGKYGKEKTEIVKVNGAVTAGSSLTITGTVFGHGTGIEVRKVLFNQWKIYGNSTNTTVGATLIATVDIAVNDLETVYVNTGTEYAYYFVLPFDSYNTVSGDYSDGVARSAGYQSNTVGYLIHSTLTSTKKTKGGNITDEWFIQEMNDCSEFIASKLKRWSHLQSFNYVLGQTSLGLNSYTLPSDIQDKNSNKSILSVRLGGEDELDYTDKRDWNDQLEETIHTQVTTQALAGDVQLAIDNSYDFADAGSVDVFVSNVKYTLTYTSVTRSATAGVLLGIPATGTGSITVTIPVDSNVWYGQDEGNPIYFNVSDGTLTIYPLPDSSYDKLNVYLDYYTSRTRVDSSTDAVEPTRYLMYKHWLCWKLKGLDNASGMLNLTDADFILFTQMLNDSINKEISGQRFRTKPRVNKISY